MKTTLLGTTLLFLTTISYSQKSYTMSEDTLTVCEGLYLNPGGKETYAPNMHITQTI
ncbi:hypothetical protein [Xanthovirga aplysinae]|uniref:hypothetical protein n=1 Tax=Xanthovirga aplysinae TaxID=2529853 RepID=UPI0012BB757C|nr:hypothetical protein [Xanthovirga aplysinae]